MRFYRFFLKNEVSDSLHQFGAEHGALSRRYLELSQSFKVLRGSYSVSALAPYTEIWSISPASFTSENIHAKTLLK